MKRKRGVNQGTRGRKSRKKTTKPSFKFKRGRTRKGIKNAVHSMKPSNQLKVVNIDKPSNNTGTAWQPDILITEDLVYGIAHENVDKELATTGVLDANIIVTSPEDLARACSRRSGNEIYLTSLRIKYKLELNNDPLLNQYGEGVKLKMMLVVHKYEQGIPIRKDMFAFSNAYQKHKNAMGNEIDHAAMFTAGVTPQAVHKGRDFNDDSVFFDKFEKINAGINKKRYTVCKTWSFYFKRKYIGDEQIKRGVLTYPFKNQKIKYWSSPKQDGESNTYVTRPSKNYKLIMFYERLNGDANAVDAVAPIKVEMHGDIYWKDAAPFDC